MVDWKRYKKEDLERIKISKEIDNLNQSFLAKNFSGLVALIIGFASVSIGIYTGIFDVKKESLIIQKENLIRDIKEFKQKKDSLKNENDSLRKSIHYKQSKINTLQKLYSETENQFNDIKLSYDLLNSNYSKLRTEVGEPHISIANFFIETDIAPGIVLENSGSTAIIDEYRAILPFECIIVNSNSRGSTLLSQLKLNPSEYSVISFKPGDKIVNGKKIVLLGVTKDKTNKYNETAIRRLELIRELGFLIKYHTLTGKKREFYAGPSWLKRKNCY